MNALVVDDSAALRARLALLLRETCGIDRVDEASSAHEALAYLLGSIPDVVILDLHMPGKNGLEILPRIKDLVPAPVVIVLTNEPSEHHRRQAMAQGADFFFDKSKDFARILDVVASVRRPCA